VTWKKNQNRSSPLGPGKSIGVTLSPLHLKVKKREMGENENPRGKRQVEGTTEERCQYKGHKTGLPTHFRLGGNLSVRSGRRKSQKKNHREINPRRGRTVLSHTGGLVSLVMRSNPKHGGGEAESMTKQTRGGHWGVSTGISWQ